MKYILDLLIANADEKYGDFHSKLVPTVDRDKILGVRTPVIRKLARELVRDEAACKEILPEFLNELPHRYYDETVLHGEIISLEKSFDKAIDAVNELLPYIDNWAACDLLNPKVFGKHKEALKEHIDGWLKSDKVYTARFGIDMMIKYFLDGDFKYGHLAEVRDAAGDDYYIKMAKAWYYSIALVKQYDVAFEFVTKQIDDPWIRMKSLQKARESLRISKEQREALKNA